MSISWNKGISFTLITVVALALLVGFYLILIGYTYLHYHPKALFELMKSAAVRHAIAVSLVSATIATFFALLCSLPASYLLSRKEFAGKIFVDAILDIPVFVSPVALGALLLVFFTSPLSKFFQEHTFPVVFAVPGIIIAQFTVVTGLTARMLKAAFDQIPRRYEEVARTLGCSPFQAFRTVTLPLAKNGIVAAAIITWARAIGEFGATITLVGAAEMKTETIPTAIALSFSAADVDRALTMVAILILTALSGLLIIRFISGTEVRL
ncbi:MAG TPA: ABC transporter permease subunit [Thermodesulfobacteriota bacterium]|nr:ABC transporter permease subunit [Deltaproteobacteria bacterium]HNR12830.1 ABC transporter permease subunit [Thermodesulfobacteriota bacterium]HNU72095.1 ABC transporter permease subunit [Thermodesulfobacteriota bacterium]HOC39373.1 ABC transporter permease subunit [Thermodesulfobacteriota bacterium]HQO77737.1 ABC transporter permease subunit [Thermodesulfobacteriota bacterium]